MLTILKVAETLRKIEIAFAELPEGCELSCKLLRVHTCNPNTQRQKYEGHEFKANLGYLVTSYLKIE